MSYAQFPDSKWPNGDNLRGQATDAVSAQRATCLPGAQAHLDFNAVNRDLLKSCKDKAGDLKRSQRNTQQLIS